MPYEDDIRAAFGALADKAPEAEDVLTAIRSRQADEAAALLDGSRPARNKYQKPPGALLRRRALVPAAAALAVVGLIVASTMLSGGTAPRGQAPTSQNAGLLNVPRYYLAPGDMVQHDSLAKEGVLHATFTGKPVATFHLPRPYDYISGYAGAGTGRTFVVAGQNTATQRYVTAFFLARFDPGSRKVTLAALHIPTFFNTGNGGGVTAMALSQTASRLAIVTQSIREIRGKWEVPSKLTVYSLPSGRAKAWSFVQGNIGMGFGELDPRSMSWSRSGVLAYNLWNGGAPVRLLDPSTSASGSLLAHSRLVVSLPGPSDAIVTPDGTRLVAAQIHRRPQAGKPLLVSTTSAVYEFSTATGKIISVRDKRRSFGTNFRSPVPYVYWTNSSGSVLLVGTTGEGLGVLVGNRLIRLHNPLPLPADITSWIVF
jgi:hypothetical protein